ncbi:hypothetical protein B0H16DRAFT_1590159 [Mycena metata]|uniref:DUF6534 domain-containing protein n=1 Tax=Mycena metata TaxID=1033252 RepID=A0AAD7HUE1_9AGAR|nr:hypothetical protein B0H16DRAFT_1590159 [Mycena metata]
MASGLSVDLSTTLGADEIGVLFAYFLLGVATCQVYIYYSRFPDDSVKLKTLVAIVWLAEFGRIVCIGSGLFTYTIFNYGRPETVVGPLPKALDIAILIGGIPIICVQGFFLFRIYAFSKRLLVPVFICVVTSMRCISGTALMVTSLRMKSLVEFEVQWGWLFTAFWSFGVVSDVGLTVALVALFLRQRPSGQKRTVALLDKLILWTLETGMLTSVTMISEVIFFHTMKNNFIWAAPFTLHTLLYSNSLLASLNSRATLRAMNEVSLPSLHLTAALANGVQLTPDTAGIMEQSSKISQV